MNEPLFQIPGMHGVALTVLTICLVAALGLWLGRLRVRGMEIGIGGVLFAGILFGHFGAGIEAGAFEFIREFGLILFVYTIGIQVGPGFFSALKKSGLTLNLLAAAIVVLGVLVTSAIYLVFDVPLPAVLGLFSGAVTNTPSLGAGQEMLKQMGADASASELPGLGYAVAYPFGIAGILIAMLVIRAFLRISIPVETGAFERQQKADTTPIETMSVEVRNTNVDGLTVRELPGLAELKIVISRIYHQGTVRVAHPDVRVSVGDVLLLVGPPDRINKMKLILGEESPVNPAAASSELRWERLVVTNTEILGKEIPALDLLRAHNVVVSRVTRAGVELVPAAPLRLQFGDILSVIGTADDIHRAAGVIGNEEKRLRQAQVLPIFIGIALGVALGSIPFSLPGMPAALKLGLAGGPLLAAILLARLGHVGKLVWFIPPAANHVLRDIGIVLFLAVVGLRSGGRFVETLVEGDGLLWILYGAMITLIPLLIVGFVGRVVFRLNYLTVCGLLSGSMTDPPALAFANNLSTSEAPALAYATVYPLVMCLRILAPQVMVLLLWSGT
jgi:putative transport protein